MMKINGFIALYNRSGPIIASGLN